MLARERWAGGFLHQQSRTSDIVHHSAFLYNLRSMVPCIDLRWVCTLCWHLGDLQLTLFLFFKEEDLWFFATGEEVPHSLSQSPG